MRINCNSGAMRTNTVGDFVGHCLGGLNAWYIPEGIANIFSVNELEKRYCITYYSWQGYYLVHTKNGEVRFYKDKNGLPFIDLKDLLEEEAILLVKAGSKEAAKVFVQTVGQKHERFTKRKVLEAKEARCAMGIIGNPGKEDFKGMVRGIMIKNCPVTLDAITNARAIFGPNLPSLQGKTVQRTPALVVSKYVSVQREVVERNKTVTLAADEFFVDGTVFLLSVSRQIKYITAEHVATRMAKSLSKHLTQVVQIYAQAGFIVCTILMDGEFEKVKDKLRSFICNTTAAKEHMSDAEQISAQSKNNPGE